MDNETYQGWLLLYKRAHAIKSPVKYNANKSRRLPLAEGVFEDFIKKIDKALLKSSAYLNAHKVPMPKPLWVFSNDDPTTWPSSPTFAYGHLLG